MVRLAATFVLLRTTDGVLPALSFGAPDALRNPDALRDPRLHPTLRYFRRDFVRGFRRFADDQGGSDANRGGLFAVAALDPVDQDARGSGSHLVTWLDDGGQVRMEWAVHGEIVEGSQGHVLRAANA